MIGGSAITDGLGMRHSRCWPSRRSGRRTMRTVTGRLAAVLLIFVACAAEAQIGVQGLADRWVQAYNRHDAAALGELYTEDARLMMHGSPTIAGRGAIASFW